MKIAIPLYKNVKSYMINHAYLDYIEEAEYIPIPIAPTINLETVVKLASQLDGLILPGGPDVEPTFYGMDNVNSFKPDLARDNFERFLYHTFKSLGKPILGICRGFQLIFLEEGLNEPNLTFYQHIKGHNQSEVVDRNLPTHNVIYSKLLYDCNEDPELNSVMFVNSLHHQGVKIKGKKVRFENIIPLAFHKDVLEAFMIKGTNTIAVQWHPEELKDVHLLWRLFDTSNDKEIGNAE